MGEATQRRPAVPWAIALLAGMVLGRDGGELPSLLGLGVCVLASGLSRGGERFRRLGGLAVVCAIGAALSNQADLGARARPDGWLPEDGRAIECSVVGRLLDVPAPGDGGEVHLFLAARPEAEPERAPIHIALRVLSSPEAATAAALALLPGDQVRAWCRVRLPRRSGDPELPDPRLGLWSRGSEASGSIKSARLVERLAVGKSGPRRLLGSAKAAARKRLERALGGNPRARAVLGAMLLGDRAALDPADARVLRSSGLVHLLSISGLHVGLSLALLLAVLARTRLGPIATLLTLSGALAALVTLTGGQPPVVRSALAAGVLLLGRVLGRDGDPLNTLAVVAAALASVDPFLLWNPSFQLTFAATAGLLAFARRCATALPLPRLFSASLGVSAAAYLTSTPILIEQFGRVAPASLPANLGAVFFCIATLASGVLAIVTADAPFISALASGLATSSVDGLFRFASAIAAVPGGSFRVGPLPAALVATYYGLLVLALCRPRTPRLLRLAIVVLLGFMHLGPPPPGPSTGVRLAVLDVGQGQAVVLQGPTGGFVLVDAGGAAGGRFDAGERVVAPFLSRRGCRRIEVLLLSHGHEDHAGGVAAILRDFDVGELWIPPGSLHEPLVRNLVALAVEEGSAVRLVERGFVSVRAGIDLRVLHPGPEDRLRSENDRCAVLLARVAERRVLVPGDLESAGEESLLAAVRELRADVLVVAHHGASRSSTARFLDAVRPTHAVVSVGAGNRFGHPGPATLERLDARGATVHRTDRDGRTLLRGSSSGWEVEHGVTACGSEPE